MTKFETRIKQIADYLSCNHEELWSEIEMICLDKQQVKKAIDKILPLDKQDANSMITNNALKKELGL